MTEKEKAAAGLLYNSNNDPELLHERRQIKARLMAYNQLDPRDLAAQSALIRSILGSIGNDFLIEQPFLCDHGYNIHIGANFYSNSNLTILDEAEVRLGDFVFIAPNVGIYTAGHPLDVPRRNAGLEFAYPVTIGNNVWIGAGVSILPGVTIGNDTVVGAGSVVTRDLPAAVLAAGNPCRVLRPITEEDGRRYLLPPWHPASGAARNRPGK